MEGLENKLICLTLNNAWQPIGQRTVKEAICSLVSGDFFALDITYFLNGDEVDFSKPKDLNPLNWDDWLKLPVREYDFVIHSPKLTVRVPTVIIAKTYSKMPLKRMKLSPENIRIRDRNVCQYSGRKLTSDEGSVDHIVPKFLGGQEVWDNLVFCDKKINLKKGSKHLSETNLKLIKQPQEPTSVPAFLVLNEAKHQDWEHFLIK